MPLALDASTPATATSGTGSVTSASFTPPANTVLVACISSDGLAPGGTGTPVYGCSSTPALTWTKRSERIDTDAGARDGGAVVYTAVASTSQAYTVTGTAGGSTNIHMKVEAWTGADTTSPVGAVGEGSSVTNAITPTVYTSTAANSRAIAAANDWSANGTPTTTDVGYASHFAGSTSCITVHKAADTATVGTAVTLNFDSAGTAAAEWNWAAIELKPAAGGTTAVGTSRATTWNVKARVTPTRATTWRVRATVAASRAPAWRTLATAAASRATSWRVRATTLASRATSWRVLGTAAATRATTWRVRAAAAAQRATAWRVLTATAATRATTWRVLQRVTGTRATTWNVVSSLVTVGASRATSWRVLASEASARATTWNVRATVSAARSTLWDVLTTATASRATSWRVLTDATAARSTTWRVLERITALRTALWSVVGLETGFQGRILTARVETDHHATGHLDADLHATARLSIPEATGVIS